MLTLKEKLYLLKILKAHRSRGIFGLKKKDPNHDRLIEKLEQMIRNEQVNQDKL